MAQNARAFSSGSRGTLLGASVQRLLSFALPACCFCAVQGWFCGLGRADIPWRFVCSGSWILFYVIEAAAVITVLNTYPDDAEAAVRAALHSLCGAPSNAYCRGSQ